MCLHGRVYDTGEPTERQSDGLAGRMMDRQMRRVEVDETLHTECLVS